MLFNFFRRFNTAIPKEHLVAYTFYIVYLLMFVTEEVQFIFKILAMIMVLFASYRGNKLFWGTICFVLSYVTIYTWYTSANHHFLATYWAWVLFIALFRMTFKLVLTCNHIKNYVLFVVLVCMFRWQYTRLIFII